MISAIDYIPSEESSTTEFKNFLENIGVVHTFKNKEDYIKRVNLFRKVVKFTWRKDQKDVIDSFLQQEYKYYVINGIFGCGKTTMLMGIHIHSIISELYRPDEAMFLSFNVCIKNELIQKLRRYGMSSRTKVRTFDSIIYEICKIYNYPYLDLPNYEGKRKYVYKICKEIELEETNRKELSVSPRYIFIDECQDLEHQTIILFKTFFPKSQIIFAGDVFQSIQKEPRESLLWYLLNGYEEKDISKHYMKETPRVPKPILDGVKESLISYYPEFTEEIVEWRSSSSVTDTEIEWHRFYNYSDIFKKIDTFLENHDPLNSMILTFSSAITVKGAMGDLARIRRFLFGKGYEVNNDHKKMDHDKLFLSTVNSSKGLERDYVFIVSTFPLERAFVNFSNDLVINLITVGVTRSKKKVIFYVPAYEDKFSMCLENYSDCPKPNKEKIREGKSIKDFMFEDFINMEHSVTELIRQSIIKYDTRILLKERTKMFERSTLFSEKVSAPKINTEEERAFVGILIENLITSSWLMVWPSLDSIEELRNHPMYIHCFKKIEDRYKNYVQFTKKNACNGKNHFQGIYYYSQIHLGMYNKIFIDLRESTQNYLSIYWNSLRDKVQQIRPSEGYITIQNNMRMPWLTGVSDVMIKKESEYKDDENKENKKSEEITIWELKASMDMEWKDDALIQAILYGLMSGKKRCRLVLLNPFRNEKCCYYFNMKELMYMREMVINDIIVWNTNCFLSKNLKIRGKELKVTNSLFLYMGKDDKGVLQQYSLLQFMSPTKIDIISNEFVSNKEKKGDDNKKRKEMNKLEKLCEDAKEEMTEEKVMEKLEKILNSSQYKDCVVYYSGDIKDKDKENKRYKKVDEIIGEDLNDNMRFVLDMLGYKDKDEEDKDNKEKEKKYEPDFENALVKSLTIISYLGMEYKLT